jgi:4-amino-4-deoxy-L-arabinose transferase-like glycosyltransferase
VAGDAVPPVDAPSLCLPEKQPSERWIALLLFALTCSYLYLFRRYTYMDPDEGIILQGAQRILQGQVLYRDFFSFFTPGSYYFLALLFKIFGSSIIVARTALAFYGGVYSVVTYLLARRVCSRGSALFVAVLVTLTTLPFRFLALHNWDSTLWACLALYSAVRLLEFPHWKWTFAVGSLTSLTFLFEQSKGGGLGLGLGFGFLAIAWVGRWQRLWTMSQIGGLALGLAWPFLVTLAYFGAQHCLPAMLADWFWPLQHYSLANRVPYGYQNWSEGARYDLFGSGSLGMRLFKAVTVSPCLLIPVLPMVAAGLLVYWIVQVRRRAAPEAKWAYYVLISATLVGMLLSVVIVRADIAHFMYLLPLFALVLAWMVDGRDLPGRMFKAVRPVFIASVMIAFFLLGMALLFGKLGGASSLATRRGVVTTPKADTVIEYVQARVAPGETILVYPYLPLYYYLTATFSPTRYEYFQPGMNTPEQAQEIVSELASRRVRAVLYEPFFADKIPNSWPRTPLASMADDPVADYILREYRTCAVLKSPSEWRFQFMVRKDLKCPGR